MKYIKYIIGISLIAGVKIYALALLMEILSKL